LALSATSFLGVIPSEYGKASQKLPSTRLHEAVEVAESLRITGRILSRGPLHVNGEVAGTLELPGDWLTVGPTGNIRAYPVSWIREGRAWNESIFLGAFPMRNQDFQIMVFN